MGLTETDVLALFTSLKLAGISTLVLLFLGTPLAWWLARTAWRGKFLLEALIALPLVLPPTVIGFYLLLALGPAGPIGVLLSVFGIESLAFTFTGLVIGSVFYSLPFVIQPIQNAFSALDERALDAAASLGASPVDRFFSVALPLARTGILSAAVLGFAHTLGEFGIVLMIGGNLAGETQVASIALYEHVESLNYAAAHSLAGVLLVCSFVLLLGVYGLNKRYRIGAL